MVFVAFVFFVVHPVPPSSQGDCPGLGNGWAFGPKNADTRERSSFQGTLRHVIKGQPYGVRGFRVFRGSSRSAKSLYQKSIR